MGGADSLQITSVQSPKVPARNGPVAGLPPLGRLSSQGAQLGPHLFYIMIFLLLTAAPPPPATLSSFLFPTHIQHQHHSHHRRRQRHQHHRVVDSTATCTLSPDGATPPLHLRSELRCSVWTAAASTTSRRKRLTNWTNENTTTTNNNHKGPCPCVSECLPTSHQ